MGLKAVRMAKLSGNPCDGVASRKTVSKYFSFISLSFSEFFGSMERLGW